MAIRWREDLKRRWPILVYQDPYTLAEWDRAMTEVLAHPGSSPPLRLLVDRRYCQAPSADFVRHITSFIERHRESFVGGFVAVVTSDPANYGVARMAQISVEVAHLPCTVRAFKEWDDAERWLESTPGTTVQARAGG